MRAAAVTRLVTAEFRGRRLRAMLLFVAVVALSSAAIVAGLESQTQAGDRWDAAFEEANGAHVTLYADPATLNQLSRDPRVESATHPYRLMDLDLLRDGNVVDTTGVMEMSEADRPGIGRPLLRDGRWARAGATDEIVVDRAFGLDAGIDVGDTVVLAGARGDQELSVVGRAVDLVDCLYPDCEPVVWLDPAAFALLAGDDVRYAVNVRLHDAEAVADFSTDLFALGVGTDDWLDARDDTLTINEIFGAFLSSFGVFVMIAAAIVVAGSMASRAVARRRDVGLLKAVGVTPRQVAASVIAAHALAGALGVVVGWLLGGLLATRTQLQIGETLGGGGVSFPISGLVIALVVVEVIVALATALPAWRAGRVPTTAALAVVPPRGARRSRLGALGARLGAGPVGVAGLKDAFARPARSVLTALALAVAVVAVVVTLGTDRTINNVFGHPALVGDPEEIVVSGGDDPARVAEVLDGEPGVASWFTEREDDLVLDGEGFLGIALGGDVARAGFVMREGRMFDAPGEAIAGYGFLQRFGLSVGDQVTVRAHGQPIRLAIVGWYGEAEDTGEILRYPLADLQTASPGAGPDRAAVNVASAFDADAVAATLARALGPGADVEVLDPERSEEIDTFRLAFALVAGLVLVVALANLASTMLLAVRERAHDLAVMRAVGFTPAQVVTVVVIGSIVLGLVGVAIGIPLGLAAKRAVDGVIGEASGIGPGIGRDPAIWTLVALVPLAAFSAALLGALASRRAARAEVAELVRYE